MRNATRGLVAVLSGLSIWCAGCESGTSSSQPAAKPSDAEASRTARTAPPPGPDLSGALVGGGPADQPDMEREPDMESEVAAVGAGKKGRDYGGGMISEPVRAYFRTGQRIAFEIQIPKAASRIQGL